MKEGHIKFIISEVSRNSYDSSAWLTKARLTFFEKNSRNDFSFGNSLDGITGDVLYWNELGNPCLLNQTRFDIAAKTCSNTDFEFWIVINISFLQLLLPHSILGKSSILKFKSQIVKR